ncbi:MAG: acyl-CoA dehydratase activase, partial [Methanosarcinales archaeon]
MKVFISGIDAGSATTKAIIINQEKEILSYTIIPTSFDFRKAAETAYKKAIFEAKISEKEIKKIIATGYGRNSIDFATRTVSEITAHAKGVKHLIPSAHTIIDIGGQDSKVISISDSGKVIDFLMNDRCAAGTGKFLEITSRALEIPIHQIGKLCLKSVNPVNISSMCTVFAESEV